MSGISRASLVHQAAAARSALASFGRRSLLLASAKLAALWHHPFSVTRRKARVAKIRDAWKRSPTYANWIDSYDYKADRHREALAAAVASWERHPLISVLMPTYNTPPQYLNAALESVCAQIYPNWELCIADDASPDSDVHTALKGWRERDARIKVAFRASNGHISAATNTALTLATGEYITLLDHDDILPENALAELARAYQAHPDAELVYSDEDKIDERGKRFDPHFKPDWSPDLLRSQNYVNHLAAYRADTIRAIGGWREGLEGSQDYDLNLRVIERSDPRSVLHIPKVLYHWRAVPGSTALAGGEKNYAYLAGKKALEQHLERVGLPGALVEETAGVPFYRVVYPLPSPPPTVSLIIPTRDQVNFLRACVESMFEKTSYPEYEIIIVNNQSEHKETLAYLRELASRARVRVLSYEKSFNFAAMNNLAVSQARGSIVGLINNDIEVIKGDWLTELVSQAIRPEIGCVGAKLYYPDGRLQHGGVVLGLGGIASHAYLYAPRRDNGYFGRLRIARNVSAVTGACLFVRRELYERVGGLDEKVFPIEYNDIDFCLRVADAGYTNLWTPFAELYHHESVSRGHDITSARFLRAAEAMETRWGEKIGADPYYSPNLTLTRPDCGVKEPLPTDSEEKQA
jgi:GT2 family glycosyltransferase